MRLQNMCETSGGMMDPVYLGIRSEIMQVRRFVGLG